jgi:3-hydroxyethyl bacteriochlorophyllide a dehydrogenase
MKTKAIVFTDINQVSLESVIIPEPGEGEVLIEVLYSLISPGTELRCLAGKQAGIQFPCIPGYSCTGRVIACGQNTNLQENTLVYTSGTSASDIHTTWGGHTAHAVQKETNIFPLPESLDPLSGAAAHLAAIAYRGLRLAQPKPHETVAIIGLGAIGALAARLYTLSGAKAAAADLSHRRVEMTHQAGITAFVPGRDLAADFRKVLPDGADLVVDATGHPAVLPMALQVAREKPWDNSSDPGPRVVIQGSYPGHFSIPYDPAFQREMTFYVPRDSQPRDIRAVLDLMGRGKLSVDGIISESLGPNHAPDVYAKLSNPQTDWITVAFDWS